MRSGLALFPGCQGSCSIVRNGPAGLVVSFNICQGLKCSHVASRLTLTMHYHAPNAPFPESASKVVATFRGNMQKRFGWVLKDRYVAPPVLSPGLEALC